MHAGSVKQYESREVRSALGKSSMRVSRYERPPFIADEQSGNRPAQGLGDQKKKKHSGSSVVFLCRGKTVCRFAESLGCLADQIKAVRSAAVDLAPP